MGKLSQVLTVWGIMASLPCFSERGAAQLVPDLPLCRPLVTIDGQDGEKLQADCASYFAPPSFGDGSLTVKTRMFVFHTKSPDAPTSPDTLYLFIDMTDNTNDGTNDYVVLLFDTQHTPANTADDAGLCFRRNADILRVNTATTTCSGAPVPIPGLTDIGNCLAPPNATRKCIGDFGGHWSVEIKLIPTDFGLASFKYLGDYDVGTFIHAVDATGTFSALGLNAGTIAGNPATWTTLTLGVAVDVALVLDLSGSMGSLTCASPCTTTRLDVLKGAVSKFVDSYRHFAWSTDRIAVRYFQTTVTSFPISAALVRLLDPCPPSTNSCADEIISNVGNTSQGGTTALGSGLLQGIAVLPASPTTRKRHIIVFSDGMQNVPPMVDSFVDGTCPTPDLYVGGDFKIQSVCLDGLGYPIHTLGIEGTTPFMDLMNNIGLETGGVHNLTTNLGNELGQIFLGDLETALKARSPQLVAYRIGTVSNDTTREAFTINADVQRILLTLSWSPGSRLAFQVLKDGKNVTDAGRIVTRTTYQMFIMDLPRHFGTDSVTSAGQWELLIVGQAGSSYQASALVDEPRLTYGFDVGANQSVGDPIQLTAQVVSDGQPINDAIVTAVVGKPGESIGTLLSVNPTPSTAPTAPPEPGASPAQNKLQLLLEDPNLRKRIEPSNRTVQLKSLGDGKYSGTYTGTNVAGAYTVLFLLDRSTAKKGRYLRARLITANVRFGPAKPSASELEARRGPPLASGQPAALHLRPKDRFGNFLGPDYGNQIHVSLSPSAGTAGEPRDLLDGGYEVTLLLTARDPVITIIVVGDTLFSDRVSKLEWHPFFAMSVHGGISLPSGTFKTTNDRGFGVTGDLEYWFTRRLALQGLFGYHRFGGKGTNPDLEITHASAGLEFRVVTGSPSILVDVGGGTYRFKPGSSKPGSHGGVSVEFEVSPRVSVGLNGRLHTVFTTGSHTTFYSLQAGGWIRL